MGEDSKPWHKSIKRNRGANRDIPKGLVMKNEDLKKEQDIQELDLQEGSMHRQYKLAFKMKEK